MSSRGKKRSIAASMSYEAKARGVTRGMWIAEIRKRCLEAVILPSDYETYRGCEYHWNSLPDTFSALRHID